MESLSLRLFIFVQITHFEMKISYYEAEITGFGHCNFFAFIDYSTMY